jgi:aryl-alcohol dehydrogenase-like predicted oxidoreductase
MAGANWKYGWGPQTEKDSKETIELALNEDVNLFDTAPSYGHGQAEKLLGETLEDKTAKVFISSKCGLRWHTPKDLVVDLDPGRIRSEVENSLRNLKRDCIDFLSLHYPGTEQENLQAWNELLKLRNEGKISQPGVSNFSVKQIAAISSIETPSFLQREINFLATPTSTEIKFYKQNNIALHAYSPLLNGVLTNKFNKKYYKNLDSQDWRKNFSNLLTEIRLEAVEKYANKLKEASKDLGVDLQHLAINWVEQRPTVNSVLLGARNRAQLEDLIRYKDLDITTEINELVTTFTENLKLELRALR